MLNKKFVLVNIMRVLLGFLLLSVLFQSSAQAYDEEEEYYGPKKRIAVMEFESRAQGAPYGVGAGLSEMLITALTESERFIVVERKAMDQVISEQAFGMSGAVREGSEARTGELVGAQTIIKGVVTEYYMESGSGGALPLGNLGIGFAKKKGVVAMDIRMVDAISGVVLTSHRSQGEVKESVTAGYLSGDGFAIGGANYKKTPIGKAARQAVDDAVDFIISKMERVPWKGRIVLQKEGKVYVNAGKEFGIKKGAMFKVFDKGEDLVDPDTGLSLGAETKEIGIIQVEAVKDKFSIATVTKGSGGDKGDIVELMSGGEIADAADAEYEEEEEAEIPPWRIMVVIPETHIGRPVPDPAGETEIIRKLIDAGFYVIDQTSIAKIRYSDKVSEAIKDTEKAKAIAKEFDADVIIIGEAFSEFAKDVGNLISCRARVEARAIYVSTEKILAADGREASAVDTAEHIAGKKALKEAGSDMGDYFIEKLKVKPDKETEREETTEEEDEKAAQDECESVCGELTGLRFKNCIKKCLAGEQK